MERGGGRGRGDRGRGRARGRGGRDRGRGRARAGEGPQVPLILEEQPNLVEAVFGVPEHLLDQNAQVDQANLELSEIYQSTQDYRDCIVELRSIQPNDVISHQKELEVCLDAYMLMRTRGAELRDKIRKMDPPGIPFDEPEGFGVLP